MRVDLFENGWTEELVASGFARLFVSYGSS